MLEATAQLECIAPFAIEADIRQWQTALTHPGTETPLVYHMLLAWHLRQRNTKLALQHYDMAQQLLDNLPESSAGILSMRCRLALVLAETTRLMADLTEAFSAAEHAFQGFKTLQNNIGMADAYWIKAWVAYDLGNINERDHCLEQSIKLATLANDHERIDLASAGLARVSAFKDLSIAEKRWGSHFAQDVSAVSPGLQTWIHDFNYVIASKRQEVGLAVQHGTKMYQAALVSGQYERAITAASNIGFDLTRIHDLQAALEWMEKGLQLARQLEWPLTIGLCLTEMAETLRKMRRTVTARALLTEALDIMAPYPNCRDVALALNYLGDVELNCGNFTAALASFSSLLTKAETLGHADLETIACRGCAEALFRSGQHSSATHYAQKALVIAQQQLDGYNIVEALRVLARIHEDNAPAAQSSMSALDYLEQAVKVGQQIEGFCPPPELLEALAKKYAESQQYQLAYDSALQAITAHENSHDRRANDLAMALQIRHEHDKAHQESKYHRKLADAEKVRSESLVSINQSLEQLGLAGQQLTAQLKLTGIVETLTQHQTTLFNIDQLVLYLWQDEQNTLKPVLALQHNKPVQIKALTMQDLSHPAVMCALEQQEIMQADTLMAGPLLMAGQLQGVLMVHVATPYGDRERLLFRNLCAYIAIALHNAAAYQKLSDAEAVLQRNLAREKELSQLKSRFVSMTSHEFRTPLTGIQSSIDMLEHYCDRLPKNERQELFQQIQTGVSRMTEMLDNILLIGRVEANRMAFQPVPLDLSALCRAICKEVSIVKLAHSNQPKIELNYLTDVSEYVLDPILIRHMLENLLSNAIKYSPQGGTITCQVDASASELSFMVSDQGIGVPEADKSKLFDAFHRADNVGAISGTGLGLAIVKQSVELHGGHIQLWSELGKGTRFTIQLPLE